MTHHLNRGQPYRRMTSSAIEDSESQQQQPSRVSVTDQRSRGVSPKGQIPVGTAYWPAYNNNNNNNGRHGQGPYGMGPPTPAMGPMQNRYILIMLFLIAVLLAVIVIVILIVVFTVSSHQGVVQSLVERAEVVEDLARNINDASQVMRRALGERDLDEQNQDQNGNRNRKKHDDDDGGWANWLKDRGPDEEAMITDNAAKALVRGIRTFVRVMEQADRTELMAVAARLGNHADQVLSSPETTHILQAIDTVVQYPQTHNVAMQTLDLVAHVESALLPVVDALAAELQQRLAELMAGGDSVLTSERLRAVLSELADVSHKVGTGLRDLVVWYRSGGPSDATALLTHMIHAARELSESPAAVSLVKMLESIDWKQTGDQLGDSAHNAAAILQSINDAGTVDAGDHLIRAVASLLEDPGTKRVMSLLPGIAANATALLAKPNAQRLIEHGSALMARVDSVLSEAEAARTVERTAEFLSTMRLLLGALIDGGMHLEVGQPNDRDNIDYEYAKGRGGYDLERDDMSHKHKHSVMSKATETLPKHDHEASLMDGLPTITNIKPERQRIRGPRNLHPGP